MASVAPGPPEGPGYTLQVVGLADRPSELEGWYVHSYRPAEQPPERHTLPQLVRGVALISDHCHLVLVPGLQGAHRYATPTDAWEAWRQPCWCRTPQATGRPCRPLVGFTCTVQAAPEG